MDYKTIFRNIFLLIPRIHQEISSSQLSPNLGQNLGKSILTKKPATPYRIRVYGQYLLICFSFSQVSTSFSLCSCKTTFCWWQIIFFAHSPSIPTKKERKNTQKSLPFKQSCCHPNLPSSSSFLHRSETCLYTVHTTETSTNTGFLNIVPTSVHNHFPPPTPFIFLLIHHLFP